MASCLIIATIIHTVTYSLEVVDRAHINEDQAATIKIYMRTAARIITAGWRKVDTLALCTEAGLPTPYNLIKRTVIQEGARLIACANNHRLH